MKDIEGQFERGDTVAVLNEDGREIARGLIAYDADDARKIAGHKSDEISDILGYDARAAMIHRNDLVVRGVTTSETEEA